jgi:chemotaxis protein methyltransferase WspC
VAKEPAIRPATDDDGIDQIRSLADRGHVADAARLCEDYLRDHGSSAEGLHLFGVIRDATGKHQEAAAYYRKALYLDPNHHDALAHLALLLERQGDYAGARLLNERVRRLEQRQSG